MKKKKLKKSVQVRRITIDEKLSDDLIRLLSSSLKRGFREFKDRMEYWEEEKELLVRPNSYAKKMGIPLSNKKKWKWEDFKEGQAFLSGNFGIVYTKKTPGKFVVNPGRKKFISIDDLAKKDIKKIYFKALGRR